MKTFEQFKRDFAAACKLASACQEEFKKLLASENWQELLTVIKNNANWCYNNKVINADILIEVPDEELLLAGIYVKKENVTQTEGRCYYYSSTSEHYGSSTSEHYDSDSYGSVSTVNVSVIHDRAIIRERSTGKVYYKNGSF